MNTTPVDPALDAFVARLSARDPELGLLLSRTAEEQRAAGYADTLREICQQPLTWRRTAAAVAPRADELRRRLSDDRIEAVVLTGSGSSCYAAECALPGLRTALGRTVEATPSGLLLTHPALAVPPRGAYLVVSFARSGNSPESCAVLEQLLEDDPRSRHLVVTCNAGGRLALGRPSDPRVSGSSSTTRPTTGASS